MKKPLHLLFILIFFTTFSYAQSKEEVTSAINILCSKIGYLGPYGFNNKVYTELAYLKRTFNLTKLDIKDSIYISRLNDYYYKRLFLYSKLMNENAVVTEDCLIDDANDKVSKGAKVLFYCLYPKSIKLPSNIIDQIEEYATEDEFYGPYLMLYDIYFLKKYNYENLSKAQKDKLASVEKYLSGRLYTKYVENKPWEFHRFLSVKVLKMNNCDLVSNIDFYDLVKYFNANGALELGEEDTKQMDLLKTVGYKEMLQYEINAVLWIFLLEVNKK